MIEDIESLLNNLKEIHSDLKVIDAKDIEVAEWVALKCRYGCRAFGKHLCCPPYTPSPAETRRILAGYTTGVIARFEPVPNPDVPPESTRQYLWDSVTGLHHTIFELERRAFLLGCYKAFGFSAMPCTLCKICVVGEKIKRGEVPDALDAVMCRHKDMMRPSMEACGIDVFKTLRRCGFDLKPLTSRGDKTVLFGLLLLD